MRCRIAMSIEVTSDVHAISAIRRVVGVSVLIAACLATLAIAAEGADAPETARWAGHPALEAFALKGQNLPAELYLVRTRGNLPETAGVVVHGVRRGLFLISADPLAVMELSQRGCDVTRLTPQPVTARTALRQWTRVDVPDPDIEAIVAEVNWAEVSAKIQWLVDFGTRYSYAPNHFAVANSIAEVFESYGLEPVMRSFEYGGVTMWNVEATQPGTVYPDSLYIICGHFDSTSNRPSTSAPGADDNGSGAAAVLTAAEILTPHDFEYSVRYICFGGEEQGLVGSEAYAAWAAGQNLGIVGVLNFDMMGYWTPGVEKDLEIETNEASQWLAAAIVNAADLYTGATYELHVYDGAWWGDHASFWAQGYAAVNHEEAWDWYDPDFNPYYHTTNDLLIHVDPDFTVGNIQIGVAALATLAVHVPEGTGVGGPVATPQMKGSLRAHPTPFQAGVQLTVSGVSGRNGARILIFDALGRQVDALTVALRGGQGTALWNAMESAGRKVASGVYFARLEGVSGVAPVKLVHVK